MLPLRLIDQRAVISGCGLYRYWLMRDIDILSDKILVFIMLNPSTADHTQDDPTIRRCMNFARAWGYGKLIVVNLFAFRATDPSQLWAQKTIDPIGPDNDLAIEEAVLIAKLNDGIVVCAWGSHGKYMDRGNQVIGMIDINDNIYYLKMSKSGQPCHPLYLPGDLKPIMMP